MLLIRDLAQADYPVVEGLLDAEDLAVPGVYDPEGIEVIVALVDGVVGGVAEFRLDYDFGRDDVRPGHTGPQAWVLTMAVAAGQRRLGLGRALVTEIARRAQDASRTYLALVPQDGDDEPDRQKFFAACGLVPIEPEQPGRAWGRPVAEILALERMAPPQSS
ncbi:GNAT family N-acetyltransferase [Streptomyces sp. NPDC002602]|uniref:GNAT family N-acetyltransferase n=1 Tax=Streptomyces sp. NPDC002602 TaxID=3364654 RepID=UPI0036AE5477